MVLGEGMSARFHRQRRCLHDLAGTYVVNANRTSVPYLGVLSGKRGQPIKDALPLRFSCHQKPTGGAVGGDGCANTLT